MGKLTILAASVVLVGAVGLQAERVPPEYVQNMRDIVAATGNLRKNSEANAMDAVARDAAQLQALFGWKAKFWEQRSNTDAASLGRSGSRAAGELAEAERIARLN